jgi:hypothetical protein
MCSLSFCHGSYLQFGLPLMYRVGALCREAAAHCSDRSGGMGFAPTGEL